MKEWIRAICLWVHRRTRADRFRSDETNRRALLAILPLARTRRGPFYRPILLALAAAAVYAWDPQRLQLFQSLTGAVHTQRFIPLMPAGVIFWVAALQICSPALGDTTCSRVSPSSRSPTPATHALLVDPAETASICLYGHGQAVESRWRRSFQC
jgi:hypothetical protein